MAHAKNPDVVQVAERFLWTVLLTDRYDYLFREMDWMPRESNFNIGYKSWQTIRDVDRLVLFQDNGSLPEPRIVVELSGESGVWVPTHISFSRLKKAGREDNTFYWQSTRGYKVN
jgi:hypothetical protein